MNGGAFQIARQLFDSEVRTDKPCRRLKVWIYLLGRANFKDGNKYEAGTLFTDYETIYHACFLKNEGVNPKSMQNFVKWAKGQDMLRIQKRTRGMTVNIVKYKDFQTLNNYKQDTENTDGRIPAGYRQDTKGEEGKNDIKKYMSDFETLRKHFPHARTGNKKLALAKWNERLAEIDEIKKEFVLLKRKIVAGLVNQEYLPAFQRRLTELVITQEPMLTEIWIKVIDKMKDDKTKMQTMREELGEDETKRLGKVYGEKTSKRKGLLSSLGVENAG